MPRFRFIEQTPSLDGTVTVIHVLYGHAYEFYIKADGSGLAGLVHEKTKRATWFEPEARHYAEAEARRRKIIK
jgi:hypothetical protein